MWLLAWIIIPVSVIFAAIMEEPVITTLDPRNPPTTTTVQAPDVEGDEFGRANATFGSGRMFDKIAKDYDLGNLILSFGLDKMWRQTLMRDCMQLESQDHVLDLATGTADVTVLAASELSELDNELPVDSVVGIDPSPEMLKIGLMKTYHFGKAVRLAHGDAMDLSSVRNISLEGKGEQLPGVASDSINKISMSFGIRNVPNRSRAFQEMRRVLQKEPRSRVCILEFSIPTGNTPLAMLAQAFIKHAVPFLGRLTTGAAKAEYEYLQRSIAKFPQPMDFAAAMAKDGLGVESITSMAFGAVNLYTAVLKS